MLDESLFGPADPAAERAVRWSRRVAVQRRLRLLRRAAQMGPAELVQRVRQRFGSGGPGTPTPPRDGRDAGDLGLSVATLTKALDERFLVGPSGIEALLGWMRQQASDDVAAVHAAAEGLRVHGVEVFGQCVSLRDGRVPWAEDPETARAWWPDAPLDEDGAIAAVSGAAGAVDVKRVWELGRHQYLVPLALDSWLSGEPAGAALAGRTLGGWLAENPPGRGVHWASPLEIGLRAIAWLWTMPWLLRHPALPPEVGAAWADALGAHYQVLRARLSVYTDPTNHLIGEATAVWMLATVCPTLPEAGAVARDTIALLAREVARQVGVDGVSEEQAIGYHCFVLEFLVQIVALGRRTGAEVPDVIIERTGAMARVLDAVLGRGGELPQFGDWDDGRAMPCFGASDWRRRAEGLARVGAALAGGAVRTGIVGAGLPERLLLGAPAVAVSGYAPSVDTQEAVLFDRGGLAVSDTRRGDGAVQVVMRVGGFGALVNAGHAHADALSVLLRVNDQLLLGDPGTGSYTGPRVVRETFRATRLHNTVCIDGLSQADPLDVFKWINLPSVGLDAWRTDAACTVMAASHDGYARLRAPVWHRRDVLVVRDAYVLVIDRLAGCGAHAVRRTFATPPSATVSVVDGHATVAGSGGVAVSVWVPDDEQTVLEPIPWSPGYGRWVRSQAVVVAAATPVPAVRLTVLVPSGPGLATTIVTDVPRAVPMPDGWVAWEIAAGRDDQRWLDRLVVSRPGADWGSLRAARAPSLLRTTAAGTVQQLAGEAAA